MVVYIKVLEVILTFCSMIIDDRVLEDLSTRAKLLEAKYGFGNH